MKNLNDHQEDDEKAYLAALYQNEYMATSLAVLSKHLSVHMKTSK